jgi:hypothetical protein
MRGLQTNVVEKRNAGVYMTDGIRQNRSGIRRNGMRNQVREVIP